MSQTDENIAAIDEKLEELIVLLSRSKINSEAARYFKQQFDHAVSKADVHHKDDHIPRDEFNISLSSKLSYKYRLERYLRGEKITNIIFIIIGLTMIVMGIGMIIIPAPPFFEMFTIYYFNRTDGITIMDLISLLIILAGVYFLIKGLYPNPARKSAGASNLKKH